MSGLSQETTAQTFGWPFGSAGALALAFSVGPWVAASTSNYRPMDSDYQTAALCAGGGLLAVAWELWRRRGRVVLAPVRGGLGVYRKGELHNVALPAPLT